MELISQANTMEARQVAEPGFWAHLCCPTSALALTPGSAGSHEPQGPRAPGSSPSLFLDAGEAQGSVPPTPAPRQPQSGRRKV